MLFMALGVFVFLGLAVLIVHTIVDVQRRLDVGSGVRFDEGRHQSEIDLESWRRPGHISVERRESDEG